MRANDWDQQLLNEHREYVTSLDALAAFEELADVAERLVRYHCGPAWHGDARVFRYTDRFAPVPEPDVSDLPRPRSAEDRNWYLPAAQGVRTDRNVQPGKLPHVVFSTIAVGGATMASIQAAMDATVAANDLAEERHTALRLLEWAARDRGVSFACIDGVVTATGYRLQPARPFEFIVTRSHLRFYVRPAGRHRIAGGLAVLSAAFPQVEHLDDHWVINIANRDDARRLQELVFAGADLVPSARLGRPYVPAVSSRRAQSVSHSRSIRTLSIVATKVTRPPRTRSPRSCAAGASNHAPRTAIQTSTSHGCIATRHLSRRSRALPTTTRSVSFGSGWGKCFATDMLSR